MLGGRYRRSAIVVTCTTCGAESRVDAETEYGATTWTPDECRACGDPFDGDAPWREDEPPEVEP